MSDHQPNRSVALTLEDVRPFAEEAWPLPGSGDTARRFRRLSAIARSDLPLVKVVEPHHDAAAILHDLGCPPPSHGSVWAVWAAEPPFARVTATESDHVWHLTGTKAFCSGARTSTDALVTAYVGEESALFRIRLDDPGVTLDDTTPSWTGHGMRRAGTESLAFDHVAATPVGRPGAYTARPGFWHGAIGIAACWYGGALGVVDTLERANKRLDRHGLAHLGAVRADLDCLGQVLDSAARVIDCDPGGDAHRLALSTRTFAADVVDRVCARVGRALGPGPLAFDQDHADRVADLQVFVRQHHAERDLEQLGSLAVIDE